MGAGGRPTVKGLDLCRRYFHEVGLPALRERFPNTVTRIYYGSTECGLATALPDIDTARKPG
ncbi:MAG: hypothetical protein MUQ26_03250, partial [Armatimonadetes bacterium]|nr:hypothetical protein [Armatimonadota bacterium]